MEKLYIKKTNSTPAVIFNPKVNKFQIIGQSWGENASAFYDQVINWFEGYFSNNPSELTVLEFRFTYFNTATAIQISRIIAYLAKKKSAEHNVKIQWYYYYEDTEIKKDGLRFKEIAKVNNIDFEMIEHSIMPNEEIQ